MLAVRLYAMGLWLKYTFFKIFLAEILVMNMRFPEDQCSVIPRYSIKWGVVFFFSRFLIQDFPIDI